MRKKCRAQPFKEVCWRIYSFALRYVHKTQIRAQECRWGEYLEVTELGLPLPCRSSFEICRGGQNTRWWDRVPTQYLAKRAIRAPGGPRWVPGPHPGEALGDCQCPVSGIDRDRQTWHTGSAGVTTDHALWPNRHHNRQSAGGMNRVTSTPLTITLSLRISSSSSSNTRFTFVPCTFNCQVLVASTTHISDNRAAQVLSQRNPLLPRLRFVPQKKKGVWGSVEVSCGDRNARQAVSNWGPGRVTPIRRGTPVSSSWCNSLVGTLESRFKRYLHYVGWIIRLEPSAWKLQSPPLTLLGTTGQSSDALSMENHWNSCKSICRRPNFLVYLANLLMLSLNNVNWKMRFGEHPQGTQLLLSSLCSTNLLILSWVPVIVTEFYWHMQCYVNLQHSSASPSSTIGMPPLRDPSIICPDTHRSFSPVPTL